MKLFFKINLLSLLLGVMYFFIIIFLFAGYSGTVFLLSFWTIFILLSYAIFKLIKNWLKGSKWSFVLTITWFPYFILSFFVLKGIIPLFPAGDENYGAALLSIMLTFFYPVYILVIASLGHGLSSESVSG